MTQAKEGLSEQAAQSTVALNPIVGVNREELLRALGLVAVEALRQPMLLTKHAGAYGADLGTELFLAPRLFMSFAIGYVHLTDGFARKTFDSFSVDTWSFKLGFGL